MTPNRKYSLAGGILYLLTFVSIPTLSLYQSVKAPGYVTRSGSDTPVLIGVLLEMTVALANIGTAAALYPVVKRYGQARAIGFVGSRTLEAATMYLGIISLMSIVALRQSGLGASAIPAAQGLASQYKWAFFFAQSFIPAINGVLLGSLLYQSRLVPRWLPTLGLIGSALLALAWLATFGGLIEMMGPVTSVATIPIAVWEFSLGIYLTFWGFRE